jgi:hypothetical protein
VFAAASRAACLPPNSFDGCGATEQGASTSVTFRDVVAKNPLTNNIVWSRRIPANSSVVIPVSTAAFLARRATITRFVTAVRVSCGNGPFNTVPRAVNNELVPFRVLDPCFKCCGFFSIPLCCLGFPSICPRCSLREISRIPKLW